MFRIMFFLKYPGVGRKPVGYSFRYSSSHKTTPCYGRRFARKIRSKNVPNNLWANLRILQYNHFSKHLQSLEKFRSLSFELYVCTYLTKQPKNPKTDQIGCNGPFWSLNVLFFKIWRYQRISHPENRVYMYEKVCGTWDHHSLNGVQYASSGRW